MDSLPNTQLEPHIQRDSALWLKSAAGVYLQEKTQALYDAAVFDLFGFNALQMGFAQMDLLQNARIPNRFIVSDQLFLKSDLYCADDFLPFSEMSIDLLLLPHRLEFSERPHQTLREAARVLMPEGHLIISGFNPGSLWWLKSLIKKIACRLHLQKKSVGHLPNGLLVDYPWHARMIRLSRLKDWLALLGFEVLSVEVACHAPPFSQEHWLDKGKCLDDICHRYLRRFSLDRLGGVYFIVAKKRVPGMMPLKPKWKTTAIPTVLVAKPKPTQQQQKNNQEDI